jgi:hypothetical protein
MAAAAVAGRAQWLRRAAMVLLALAVEPAGAQPAPSQTLAQAQAAYLVNFVRYAEWPAERFAGNRAPFVIVVAGPGWVYNAVRTASRQVGHVRQRPLQVVHLPLPRGAGELSPAAHALLQDAHLLFVHGSHARWRRPLLDAVAGHSVLTVGSGDGFVADGGMLGLLQSGRKLRLQADPEAIRRADVQLSAKVLKLATTNGEPR